MILLCVFFAFLLKGRLKLADHRLQVENLGRLLELRLFQLLQQEAENFALV